VALPQAKSHRRLIVVHQYERRWGAKARVMGSTSRRTSKRSRTLGDGANTQRRHTCATLLLSRNVNPKIVSEMLGHASIAITLDTYSHVLPNMQQNAVRALEEALK
jgi:integrase